MIRQITKTFTNDAFLCHIQQLLEANLDDETFGVLQLAQAIYLSECQLYRKVKARTGQSTAAYMRSYRLARGRQLLSNSQLSVREIAYRVGFSDPCYFSRTFSREYGLSPTRARA